MAGLVGAGRALLMPLMEAAASPMGRAFSAGLAGASTAHACRDMSETVMSAFRGTRTWSDVGMTFGLTMTSTILGGAAGRMAPPGLSDGVSVATGVAFDTAVAHGDQIADVLARSRLATPEENFGNPFTGD